MRTTRCSVISACVMLCLIVGGVSAAAAKRPAGRVSPAPEVNANAVVWRTSQPPNEPQAGDVWVNPKDGMEMVYVPAGEFILGSSDAQIDAFVKETTGGKREGFPDQQPQCRVSLAGYWIGRTEVTNAQYARFVQETHRRAPRYWPEGKVPSGLERSPVVYVSWEDATAYCQWAGGRLPTELEWEKAARGTDGRLFPWGSDWDPRRCRSLETITGKVRSSLQEWTKSHDRLREGLSAVGSYPTGASPYGAMDMSGNVAEWCADWYEKRAYERYARGDLKTPTSGLVGVSPVVADIGEIPIPAEAPARVPFRVLRGGSYGDDSPVLLLCTFRRYSYSNLGLPYFGFRCARGRF